MDIDTDQGMRPSEARANLYTIGRILLTSPAFGYRERMRVSYTCAAWTEAWVETSPPGTEEDWEEAVVKYGHIGLVHAYPTLLRTSANPWVAIPFLFRHSARGGEKYKPERSEGDYEWSKYEEILSEEMGRLLLPPIGSVDRALLAEKVPIYWNLKVAYEKAARDSETSPPHRLERLLLRIPVKRLIRSVEPGRSAVTEAEKRMEGLRSAMVLGILTWVHTSRPNLIPLRLGLHL